MKYGIIAGHNATLSMARVYLPVFRLLGFRAYADEQPIGTGEGGGDDSGNGTSGTVGTGSSLNYEDLIQKARKEEKDKQYKVIEKLRTELRTMTNNNNSNLIRIGELDEEVKSLNAKLTSAGSGDSEAVKTLKKELETSNAELEKVRGELKTAKDSFVDESELRKKIEDEVRAEYEVKNYRLEVLAKNTDVLVPELVTGTTKEEIDNSLKVAKTRSEEIRSQFSPQTPQGQNNMSGNSIFAGRMPAVSSPNVQSSLASVSMQDLAKLDPASPEYAEMRRKLGLR